MKSIENRKARFRFHILETLEVGLQLTGTEIKSVRDGSANIAEAYLAFKHGELFLLNAHIAPYRHGNIQNHDPLRPRKCLANRQELTKLRAQLEAKGLTLVPLKLYFKKQWLKCQIGVARGKKLFDKRRDRKERSIKRQTQQATKRSRGEC